MAKRYIVQLWTDRAVYDRNESASRVLCVLAGSDHEAATKAFGRANAVASHVVADVYHDAAPHTFCGAFTHTWQGGAVAIPAQVAS